MVANCFVSIANGMGADATKGLVHVFVQLLKDTESEVSHDTQNILTFLLGQNCCCWKDLGSIYSP